MKLVSIALALVLLAAPLSAFAGDGQNEPRAAIDKEAPEFALTGVDGKEYKLSAFRGKYVVLEWTNPDCPFVRKHYGSGNMQALQSRWEAKEVVWLTICSSAPGQQGYYKADDARKNLEKSKAAPTAYLIDGDGKVGRTYGARTTPHMYVIDPKGVLIYAGAIDDKPSTKQADIKGATNYVQACLEAAMAGKPVSTRTTTPYGCSVKYAKK